MDAFAQSDDPQMQRIVEHIDALRASIDNIDMAIVALLAERFKATAQVGALKARAGFAPADYTREEQQMQRLRRVAQGAGLDVEIAEQYREFVVTEAKRRHRRIAEEDGDAGVLDVFA
nr:chorismate mutase [Bifidobacterium choerinum]